MENSDNTTVIKSKVDPAEWAPIGDLLFLKPIDIEGNSAENIIEEVDKDLLGFELIGFGTKARPNDMGLTIGDHLIIIADRKTREDSFCINSAQHGQLFGYNPSTVALILKDYDNENKIYTTVIPVNHWLLGKRLEAETTIGDFLLIPENQQNNKNHVEVVLPTTDIVYGSKTAVPPKYKLNAADRLIINKWEKNDITFNMGKYILINEKNILAKVEK